MEPVTLFDIAVLNCEWFDVTEEGTQYNEVEFLIESLQHHNGKSVEIMHDWKLRIWDDEGNIIEEFFLIDNKEFRLKLYNKYPLNK